MRAAAEERGGIAGVLLTHSHADHSAGGADARTPRCCSERVGAGRRDLREPERPARSAGCRTGPPSRGAASGPFEAPADARATPLTTSASCWARSASAGTSCSATARSSFRPDGGSLAAYIESLERLRASTSSCSARATAHRSTDPAAKIDEYIEHRLMRERKLVAALEQGERSRSAPARRRLGRRARASCARRRRSPCRPTWRSSRPRAGCRRASGLIAWRRTPRRVRPHMAARAARLARALGAPRRGVRGAGGDRGGRALAGSSFAAAAADRGEPAAWAGSRGRSRSAATAGACRTSAPGPAHDLWFGRGLLPRPGPPLAARPLPADRLAGGWPRSPAGRGCQTDRFMRTLGLRRAAEREVGRARARRCDPSSTRFCAGINAAAARSAAAGRVPAAADRLRAVGARPTR